MLSTNKDEQRKIISDIKNQLSDSNFDIRWAAALFIEFFLQWDESLISNELIDQMTNHEDFSVRSSAAVCCFFLSTISPIKVPLDLVMKLATPYEDWYVSHPATSAFMTLAHSRLIAFEMLLQLSSMKDFEIAEHFSSSLLKVIQNEPGITDEKSLDKLLSHDSELVRKNAQKAMEIIKRKERPSKPPKYYPF